MRDIPVPGSTERSEKVQTTKRMFTRSQWEFLERNFGEFIGNAGTTLEEYAMHAGQRQVLAFVKKHIHD